MEIPQRLYLLQLSTTTIVLPTSTLEMVTGCYLVQTSDNRNILIDTGLPADYVTAPNAPPAEHQTTVIAHLAALGITPEQIHVLICTHFDVDHAGFNDAFVNAEHIVQREHYELARSGHPRFAAARPHWDNPALNYRLVEGDVDLIPGLTLLKTSGHAPAHQSVLVHLPRTGTVLLAIDAVVMERLFTPNRSAWPTDDNEDQLRASTQKLLDVVMRDRVVFTVFGHDGRQWQNLKKAPDYYD